MEVARKDSGEPFFILHPNGQHLLQHRGAKQILISISHTDKYAAVVAVLEG